MEKIVSFCKDWFQEYRPEGTLLNQILWTVWAVWVLLILVAVIRVIKFRLCLAREDKIWGDGSGPQKTAVVIVPIKGVTPSHTSDFFQSLLVQDYSKYRIIVTVEANDDPAAQWLSDQFGLTLSNPVWAPESPGDGLQSVQLVVAGKCKGQGQKVHNQLAAFTELTAEDQIIAFVDADIVCPPEWLAKLTCPINQGSQDPATTYRWLVPAKIRLANLFASVINASVTTQGGNARENMPWGGSMALSRQTFDDLDVPTLFAGSLNDDLRLGKAAKKAGYKVTYIRNLVRPTEIDFTWGKFFEFARRQYLQVKVFAPILYCSGNIVYGFYILGFLSVVAAIVMGHLWAWIPLILATILDQVRASTRESIYRRLFGSDRETYRRIARTSVIEHFLTPVYMAIHGLIILSTWFMNKMEWGGVRYQVEGVSKTRVLERKPIESTVSLASVGDLALPAGGIFTGLAAIEAGVAPISTVTVESEESVSVSESIEGADEIEQADESEEVVTHQIDATEPIDPGLVGQNDEEVFAEQDTEADSDVEDIVAAEEEEEEIIDETEAEIDSAVEEGEVDTVAPEVLSETEEEAEISDQVEELKVEESEEEIIEEEAAAVAPEVFSESEEDSEINDEVEELEVEGSEEEIIEEEIIEEEIIEEEIIEEEAAAVAPGVLSETEEESDITDEVEEIDTEPAEEEPVAETEVIEDEASEAVEGAEKEEKLFTFIKLGATTAAGAAAGAALLDDSDEEEASETVAEIEDAESSDEVEELESESWESLIPPGACEFVVETEVEAISETEEIATSEESVEEEVESDSEDAKIGAEWVEAEESAEHIANDLVADSDQAAWVDESELREFAPKS